VSEAERRQYVRVPEAHGEGREVCLPVRLQLPPLLLAAAELAEGVGHHVLLEPHVQGEVPVRRAGALGEGRVEHVVPEQLLVHLGLHRAHPTQPLDQQGSGLLELRDELEGVEVASTSHPLQKVADHDKKTERGKTVHCSSEKKKGGRRY
jgi:hypothetical protein